MADQLSPCIEWPWRRRVRGYGGVWWQGKDWLVHRLAWIEANGPIPEGAHVLHRCDNPSCYNEEHLFLGTHAENMADMATKGRCWNQRKTHCKRGHPLTGPNLYVCPRGRRECRICRNEATRKSQARKATISRGGE